nr:unnamed protein product [Callosobruchus chinensis]
MPSHWDRSGSRTSTTPLSACFTSTTPLSADCFSFVQYNNIVNSNGRLLDLVIANHECIVTRSTPIAREDHHHPALSINLKISQETNSNFEFNSNEVQYNFKRADFLNLYIDFLNIDWNWCNEETDVNALCRRFYEEIFRVIERHVPKFKNFKRRYPKWYTKDIISDIKSKHYFYKKFKKTGDLTYFDHFKLLRSSIKLKVSRAYSNYITGVQNNIRSNPKDFWNFINSKRKASRIPGNLFYADKHFCNPASIVSGFAEFFESVYNTSPIACNINQETCGSEFVSAPVITEECIMKVSKKLKPKPSSGPDRIPTYIVKDCIGAFAKPLCKIFNISLNEGIFPDCWKSSRVCPIFKNGKVNNVQNYRPISLICGFSKLFEMIIYEHGFMSKRSVTTNLCSFLNYLSTAVDQQLQVDIIFMDFSKAFDQINHSLLLQKMNKFGFSNNLVKFFHSYLTGRNQFVEYNGFKSKSYITTSGVPQGTNLGPLLFLIFVNDINHIITVEKQMFADDLKIYSLIRSQESSKQLQENLQRIVDWCQMNDLKLNTSKCKVMSVTRKQSTVLYDYKIENDILARVQEAKDLGITFTSDLSFYKHIDQMVRSATRMLGFIIRNCKSFTNIDALKTLFYTLVRSVVEYGCIVWSPIYTTYISKIERVQIKFMKYLYLKSNGHYPPFNYPHKDLSEQFNIVSLEHRRFLLSCCFVHKLLNDKIDCGGILASLDFNEPRFNSRSSFTFYLPRAFTNIMLASPLYRISKSFNEVGHLFDFNESEYIFKMRVLTYYIKEAL